MSKQTLPKGFLSRNGKPTFNALIMFFIYITNLPENWDRLKIHDESVEKVREYFEVDYGFDVMIMWGISINCAKSQTSKGRYISMSKAYHDSLGMVGKGYQLPVKIMKDKLR